MGEVKEAVKGAGKPPSTGTSSGGNLRQQLEALADEVSRLTRIKEDDILKEGDSMKPENERKAATLRAIHSLVTTSKRLAEDY